MSSSHKGSRLQLSGNPFVVDFPTIYLDYNNDTSGIQFASLIVPSGNPVVTMRPMEGAFGGGVAIEEATTNMLPSPTLVGQTGLATCFNNYNISTYSITPDFFVYGTNSQSISATGNNDGSQMNKGVYFNISATSGNRYTASFYGKGWENKGAISFYSSTLTSMNTFSYPKDDGWKQYVCSFTAPSTASHLLYVRPNGNMNYDFSCLINAPQIENKNFPTSFVSGNRALGSLNYSPIQMTNNFTVSAWVNCSEPISDFTTYHKNALCYFTDPSGTDTIEFFPRGNQSTPKIAFWSTSTWYYGNAVLQPNTWYHVAWTYDGTNVKIYVNGVLDSTIAVSHNYNKLMNLNVGGNSQETLNGIISDLIIEPFSTMSAEDISSIYLSNRPVFNPYDKRAYAL
jgi:hypothetical protein